MRPSRNLPTATAAAMPDVAPAAVLATATIPRLPACLRPLVESNERGDDGGWVMPAEIPNDAVALLPEATAELIRALRPAAREELAIVLGRLLVHYHSAERGEASYRMLFEDYLEDLSGFPVAVVAEAAREWRQTKVFWPKVAELLALCCRIHGRELNRLARLRFLAWAAERFGGRLPEYTPHPHWSSRCPARADLEAALRGKYDLAGIVVWQLPADGETQCPTSSPSPAPNSTR